MGALNNHSIVIATDGTAYGFGTNNANQLSIVGGNITKPTTITLLKGANHVSCCFDYTLARLGDGTMIVGGSSYYGQLGDGTYGYSPLYLKKNTKISNVKKVSGGSYHSLFLLNDGTVKSCGFNYYGQLGLGDTINRTTPTLIPNLNNVKQVSCGSNHTLFLLNDGTVKSTGHNGYSQLGLGDTVTKFIPTLIPNLNNVKQIASGVDHTVFLLNDGTVKSCGSNDYGQLGLGDKGVKAAPTLISNLNNVKQVSCGQYHTLFLLNSGVVMGCGVNTKYQLGLNDTTNRTSPTIIPDLPTISLLMDNDIIALTLYKKQDGSVYGKI